MFEEIIDADIYDKLIPRCTLGSHQISKTVMLKLDTALTNGRSINITWNNPHTIVQDKSLIATLTATQLSGRTTPPIFMLISNIKILFSILQTEYASGKLLNMK